MNGDAIMAVWRSTMPPARLLGSRWWSTSMTNLASTALMAAHGIAVEVTDVGDRYVLERMLATGATLGGEQSGHVVDLDHHTTGDGLATALMLLGGARPAGAVDGAARRSDRPVPPAAGGRPGRPHGAPAVAADLAGGRGGGGEARRRGRVCCVPRAPSPWCE